MLITFPRCQAGEIARFMRKKLIFFKLSKIVTINLVTIFAKNQT